MASLYDFFSGAGGTSSGFRKAGFKIAFGLDSDPDAAATFAQNFHDAVFVQRDIKLVDDEILAKCLRSKDVKVFSGCAPCQPFSRQTRNNVENDPRRGLLSEFSRFVRRWRPDYVFIENVPGMQRMLGTGTPFADFTRLLRTLGYKFSHDVVAASSYGVPQRRERLILLASLHGHIDLPSPHHAKSEASANVRQWIGDLPEIAAGNSHPSDPDHVAAHLSLLNLQRIRSTPEGGGRDSWPDHLKLDCHRNHVGHGDVYGRMHWDKAAPSLTTRCISYSNGRFGHPDQDRAISVREAACLQTFPRDFRFTGSIGSRARQIGNAVPPLMACEVAKVIKRHIAGG